MLKTISNYHQYFYIAIHSSPLRKEIHIIISFRRSIERAEFRGVGVEIDYFANFL